MFVPLSEGLKFSAEHRRTLQNPVNGEHGPGTMLYVLDTLLDILSQGGLPVTASHQLPTRALSTINSRLAHPSLRVGRFGFSTTYIFRQSVGEGERYVRKIEG